MRRGWVSVFWWAAGSLHRLHVQRVSFRWLDGGTIIVRQTFVFFLIPTTVHSPVGVCVVDPSLAT